MFFLSKGRIAGGFGENHNSSQDFHINKGKKKINAALPDQGETRHVHEEVIVLKT